MNQWGMAKIKQALKLKQVSAYSINKALGGIDKKEYRKAAEKLAAKKYASMGNESEFIRIGKTMGYLIAKGYEAELVKGVVDGR